MLFSLCFFLKSLENNPIYRLSFKQYYAREDIEPVVINNGIDLVWKGDVEGTFNESNKLGFIVITTNCAPFTEQV